MPGRLASPGTDTKTSLDAETTYDHADKLLGIVGEMRFLEPTSLQRPTAHTNAGAIQ
jgi:hypothetical protein